MNSLFLRAEKDCLLLYNFTRSADCYFNESISCLSLSELKLSHTTLAHKLPSQKYKILLNVVKIHNCLISPSFTTCSTFTFTLTRNLKQKPLKSQAKLESEQEDPFPQPTSSRAACVSSHKPNTGSYNQSSSGESSDSACLAAFERNGKARSTTLTNCSALSSGQSS